jgi:hypothetical protein
MVWGGVGRGGSAREKKEEILLRWVFALLDLLQCSGCDVTKNVRDGGFVLEWKQSRGEGGACPPTAFEV